MTKSWNFETPCQKFIILSAKYRSPKGAKICDHLWSPSLWYHSDLAGVTFSDSDSASVRTFLKPDPVPKCLNFENSIPIQNPATIDPRDGLRLYGAPGWNLERGPFYIYKTVVNRAKILNEWTEVFVLLKQKGLSKKANYHLVWTSKYERSSLIPSLHFLMETWNHIDECSQCTGGMFWI